MAVLPTTFRDDSAVIARALEVPNADFATGMNYGGSNAPGVGINQDDTTPIPVVGTPEQFTLTNQQGTARVPQVSSQLGATGFVNRSSVAYPGSGGETLYGDDDSVRAATVTTTGDGDVTAAVNCDLPALTGWLDAP